MDCRDEMQNYLNREIEVLRNLDFDEINEAVNAILDCRDRGGTVYTMGNGGSASTAGHFACDFSKGLTEQMGGKKFCCECLSDNTSTITAIANDIGYDEIFSYQLKDRLKPEDLVIAISGSGNSPNVLKAVEYAQEVGTPVIGVTGLDGGKLREMADFHMHVSIDSMMISEDIHMIFDHMLVSAMTESARREEETVMEEEEPEKQAVGLYRNDQEMIVDAFDRVVVDLFRENHEHGYKSFMICGCNAGVGTTSISMELAISLTVSGWNTVLVDCDLRKENRYKRRNQNVKYGLSDYIDNQIDMESILYPTNWEGLDYIACGHQEGETPVKLLCSQKMNELMTALKEQYDFIIFDVPALNSVPDAAIVGAGIDGTFLTTASGQTTFHDLETAKKQLEDAGANILGVILNKVTVDDYRHYMQDYNYFNDKEYLKRSRYYVEETERDKPRRLKSFSNMLRRAFFCILLTLLVAGIIPEPLNAGESAGGQSGDGSEIPVVGLESYHIEGPILQGQEFTISFTVKNMDSSTEVNKLKIGIHAVSGGYFLAQGQSNQIYVEQLGPGDTYDGEFTLQVLEGMESEAIPIEFSFEYGSAAGSGTNTTTISPSVSRLCEVQVLSMITSERPSVGAKAFFSLQYKNTGVAKISRLSMRVHGNIVSNDEEIELKIPEPGRQEYVENSIVFTDDGTQNLEVYLSYADENGIEYETGPLNVSTDVLMYSGDRDVYGTNIAWSDEGNHLVKRSDFRSTLQKIQRDYGMVILFAAVVLILDGLRRVLVLYVGSHRRRKRSRFKIGSGA